MTVARYRAPVCGEDFCEECGDCLACYGEDDCGGIKGKEHTYPRSMLIHKGTIELSDGTKVPFERVSGLETDE